VHVKPALSAPRNVEVLNNFGLQRCAEPLAFEFDHPWQQPRDRRESFKHTRRLEVVGAVRVPRKAKALCFACFSACAACWPSSPGIHGAAPPADAGSKKRQCACSQRSREAWLRIARTEEPCACLAARHGEDAKPKD
jgi:hypothetical protein